MSPLCQLIQTHCPHRQHKQDADSQSCKNGPNPIHMLNHGIPASVFVNVPGIAALAFTVAAIPDVNLTARFRSQINGVACVSCAFW